MREVGASVRFRDVSSLPLEVLVLVGTFLPIGVLIYFYPTLPELVPEYLNLHGDVELWGRKGFASVFRLPLMAIDLQVICFLAKYRLWQGSLARPESLRVGVALFDWFRALVAIKLGASSLETVFFSVERLQGLTTVTRATSWAASIFGVAAAVVYGYRWLRLDRQVKAADPSLSSDRSLLNFGNVWTYVFLVCLICLPLLMFWPLLNL